MAIKKQEENSSFEEQLERLQEIISLLEKGNTPLEESLLLYKEGVKTANACQQILTNVKHEIQLIQENEITKFKVTETNML